MVKKKRTFQNPLTHFKDLDREQCEVLFLRHGVVLTGDQTNLLHWRQDQDKRHVVTELDHLHVIYPVTSGKVL